jgi:hypothetical protein
MNDDLQSAACHCGAVRFTVRLQGPLRGARCDCSICSMKGAVMVGVPLDALEFVEGREHLTCYQFNTGVARHWFCSRCGIHCFHQRRSDPTQYGVNAACLEGVSPYYDFPEVPVSDGVHHMKDTGRARRAGTLRFEANSE